MSLFGNTVGFAAGNIAKKTADGAMDMNGFAITGLPEPEAEDHAASSGYVTGQITKRLIHRQGSKNLFNPREAASNSGSVQIDVYATLYGVIAGDYPASYGLGISSLAEGTYHCAQTGPHKLKAGTAYTISAELTEYESGYVRFGFREAGTNNILKCTPAITEAGAYSVTYTPEEDINVYFTFFITGGTAAIGKATFYNIMAEEGETASAYEPYYDSMEELTALVSTLLGVSE